MRLTSMTTLFEIARNNDVEILRKHVTKSNYLSIIDAHSMSLLENLVSHILYEGILPSTYTETLTFLLTECGAQLSELQDLEYIYSGQQDHELLATIYALAGEDYIPIQDRPYDGDDTSDATNATTIHETQIQEHIGLSGTTKHIPHNEGLSS